MSAQWKKSRPRQQHFHGDGPRKYLVGFSVIVGMVLVSLGSIVAARIVGTKAGEWIELLPPSWGWGILAGVPTVLLLVGLIQLGRSRRKRSPRARAHRGEPPEARGWVRSLWTLFATDPVGILLGLASAVFVLGSVVAAVLTT